MEQKGLWIVINVIYVLGFLREDLSANMSNNPCTFEQYMVIY